MEEEKLNQPVKAFKALSDSYRNSQRLLKNAEKQSKNANRQFKLSLFLTITSLLLAFVSIYPIFTKSDELYKLEKIIELQQKESETIIEHYIDFDSLHNRVKSLEKNLEEISKESDK